MERSSSARSPVPFPPAPVNCFRRSGAFRWAQALGFLPARRILSGKPGPAFPQVHRSCSGTGKSSSQNSRPLPAPLQLRQWPTPAAGDFSSLSGAVPLRLPAGHQSHWPSDPRRSSCPVQAPDFEAAESEQAQNPPSALRRTARKIWRPAGYPFRNVGKTSPIPPLFHSFPYFITSREKSQRIFQKRTRMVLIS